MDDNAVRAQANMNCSFTRSIRISIAVKQVKKNVKPRRVKPNPLLLRHPQYPAIPYKADFPRIACEFKMTVGSTLLILGAGCSVNSGYPLAKNMRSQLKQFSEEIRDKAPRLASLVQQTVDIFSQLDACGIRAETIDELAWHVHQGKLHNRARPDELRESYRIVEDAKVAVAALFLSMEPEAIRQGLPGYRRLMQQLFSGTQYWKALGTTPFRVLTFNYDRLFELAFRQYFQVDTSEAFYGPTVLNSGLRPLLPKTVEIDLQRFSLLKLHGSSGFWSPEHYGDCRHIHTIPNLDGSQEISDDPFFYPSNYQNHPGQPLPALIAFPHEKDLLAEYQNNKFPYRIYIPKIWNAAVRFASEAEEIRIIGYSCPEPDFPAFSRIIHAASQCKRIVVQNPTAEEICDELRHRFPERAGIFEAYPECF